MRGTPVAAHPMYRIMALLALGAQLRKIDGEIVTQTERDEARLLGVHAARAVRGGWLVDGLQRTLDEAMQLAGLYESKTQQSAVQLALFRQHVLPPPQPPGALSQAGSLSQSQSQTVCCLPILLSLPCVKCPVFCLCFVLLCFLSVVCLLAPWQFLY